MTRRITFDICQYSFIEYPHLACHIADPVKNSSANLLKVLDSGPYINDKAYNWIVKNLASQLVILIKEE